MKRKVGVGEQLTTPLYNRSEIIQAAASFGTTPEMVAGALRLVNKDYLAKEEAIRAIEAFLERVVE